MNNPFLHQDLEIKNGLLQLARDFKAKDEEDDIAHPLAAALLYANLADYLAANLLCGLREMSEEATREYLNGRIVIRPKRELNQPLEATIRGLKEFEFPSREKVLELLAEIKANRNKLAHEIFKTPSSELETVGDAVAKVGDKTEELIKVINAIYRDMPPSTILDTIEPQTAAQDIKKIKKAQTGQDVKT